MRKSVRREDDRETECMRRLVRWEDERSGRGDLMRRLIRWEDRRDTGKSLYYSSDGDQ